MRKATVRQELRVCADLRELLRQASDLDDVLNNFMTVLSKSFVMTKGGVVLADKLSPVPAIRASRGSILADIKKTSCNSIPLLAMAVCRAAQPFVLMEGAREPLFLSKGVEVDVAGVTPLVLGVPLMSGGSCIGMVYVDRLFDADVPVREDLDVLAAYAEVLAGVVEFNRTTVQREEGLRREMHSLRVELAEKYGNFSLVAASPAMTAIQQMIRKVAPSKVTVLLQGEPGTGKSLIARIIHELSAGNKGPFVKINCSALPGELLESELFGHDGNSRGGRIEDAEGGTLFFNEVAELSRSLQAKILKFLQDHEIGRSGASRFRGEDIRIVAATGADLARQVDRGVFREDLYYRLNVFPIRVPPLRERREDIPLLIDHFIGRTSREYGPRLRLTARAVGLLTRHDWPGNVREVENFIQRLAIVAQGTEIDLGDLPPFLGVQEGVAERMEERDSLSRLEEIEKKEIMAALERNRWVQSQAARDLGLTLRQVGYRIKKFGLERMLEKRKGGNIPAGSRR